MQRKPHIHRLWLHFCFTQQMFKHFRFLFYLFSSHHLGGVGRFTTEPPPSLPPSLFLLSVSLSPLPLAHLSSPGQIPLVSFWCESQLPDE